MEDGAGAATLYIVITVYSLMLFTAPHDGSTRWSEKRGRSEKKKGVSTANEWNEVCTVAWRSAGTTAP